MHWLTQGLRIVNFRWNQVSLWQHSILRETSFLIWVEKEKLQLVCFLLPLKREKNVWHVQGIFSIWTPLAFLPVTLSFLKYFSPNDTYPSCVFLEVVGAIGTCYTSMIIVCMFLTTKNAVGRWWITCPEKCSNKVNVNIKIIIIK